MALGLMFYEGKGMIQNYDNALKWITLSAQQGNPLAQMPLGYIYSDDDIMMRDLMKAHMWFNVSSVMDASILGSERARHERDRVAGSMTREEIAEAQLTATRWLEKFDQGRRH